MAEVCISVAVIHDKDLSFQALGLLAAGLSYPEGRVNRDQLHGRRLATVDDVNAAIAELRCNGYVRDEWIIEDGCVERRLQFFGDSFSASRN